MPLKSKKRTQLFFLAFLGLALAAVFFRHTLLETGGRTALRFFLSEVAYEELEWNEGKFCLADVSIDQDAYQLKVDRVEVDFYVDFLGMYVETRVKGVHPRLTLIESGESQEPLAVFAALIPHRFHGLKLDVEQGVLEIPESERFYFGFSSEPAREAMGTFTLALTPELTQLPILQTDLRIKDQQLVSNMKIQNIGCGPLMELIGFFKPEIALGWEHVQGQIELEGTLALSLPAAFHSVSCHVQMKEIALTNAHLGVHLQAEAFEGRFNYPEGDTGNVPFWKQVLSTAALQGGEVLFCEPMVQGEWGLSALCAQIALDPKADPAIQMNGLLRQKEKQYPITLEGKGTAEEDRTFWLELALELARGDKESLTSFISLCSLEKGAYVVQADIKNLDQDHIEMVQDVVSFSYPIAHELQLSQGEFQGKLTAWIEKGQLIRCQFENLLGQNIGFQLPISLAEGGIETLTGEGLFERDEDHEWQVTHFKSECKNGEVTLDTIPLTQRSCSGLHLIYEVKDGVLLPSTMTGSFFGMPGKIECRGPYFGAEIELNCTAPSGVLFGLFNEEVGKAYAESPAAVHASLKAFERGFIIAGAAQFGEEKVEFGCDIEELFSFKVFSNGWFRSEALSQAIYGPWIQAIHSEAALSGTLDLFGTFDPSRLQCFVKGTHIQLDHPLIELKVEELGENDPLLLNTEGRALINYDFSKDHWMGTIPLKGASCLEKGHRLLFENIGADLYFDGSQIHVENVKAECDGLHFDGKLLLGPEELSIATHSIYGGAASALKLMQHFSLNIPVEGTVLGEIFVGENGFFLHNDKGEVDWALHATMSQVAAALNPQTELKNFNLQLHFDSNTELFYLENCAGDLVMQQDHIYQVGAEHFSFKNGKEPRWAFDIHLHQGSAELVRIAGGALKSLSGDLDLSFVRNQTHFFGSKLQISRCALLEGRLHALEMQPILKCQDFAAAAQFIKSSGIFPHGDLALESLREMKLDGTVQAKIDYNDSLQSFSFQAGGKDLIVQDSHVRQFTLKGEKIGNQWIIENCQTDNLLLKTTFVQQKDTLIFPSLELTWNQLFLKGDGLYREDKNQFVTHISSLQVDIAKAHEWLQVEALKKLTGIVTSQGEVLIDFPAQTVEGTLSLTAQCSEPAPLHIKNEGPLKIFFSKETGLKLRDVDLRLVGKSDIKLTAHVAMDLLDFDPHAGLWQGSKGTFAFSPDMVRSLIAWSDLPSTYAPKNWNNNISGGGDFIAGPEATHIEGYLKDGYYGIGSVGCDLKQIEWNYEKNRFQLTSKWLGRDLTLETESSSDLIGAVTLQDPLTPAGLKLLFRVAPQEGLMIESLQGQLSGITAQLIRNAEIRLNHSTVLTGSVQVDMGQAASLFPYELEKGINHCKAGAGYELRANLIVDNDALEKSRFTGALRGKDFDFWGYQLDQLQAEADLYIDRLLLRNLSVIDEAGELTVKKIKVEKGILEAPIVQVHNFKPSFLHERGKRPNESKPLVLRQLSIFDLIGKAGSGATFTGRGSLHFTNAFRKESHPLGVPIEMLKNLGLDPGILTPVHGEIDFVLKGGKCILTDLKNTYSEGKRSEFYLAADQQNSFLDLDGNLQVDLKMKQNVLLKITEFFTLSVRGSLEKPSYSLQ